MDKLRERAREVFNQYIKLRDTDQYGNGICIDTGKRIFYKRVDGRFVGNCDAGHYITRAVTTIELDESNVHAQDRYANNSGRFANYRENLIKKVGIEEVERLEQEKDKFGTGLSVDIDYAEIIRKYEKKISTILKDKMF